MRASLGLFFFVSPLFSLEAGQILIRFENPPKEGNLVFLLYDSANTFGDFRDPFWVETWPSDGRESYGFKDIPDGEYALMVYHDENENGRLDKNFIGIPKEPVGFSNGYRPRSSPRYSKARFEVQSGSSYESTIFLKRPLGKTGQIGVGLGFLWQSTPYKESTENIFQGIPAITYMGERIQWFGPQGQMDLYGRGNMDLALMARYKIRAYEDDTSPVLKGMGDRKDTVMAGLALKYKFPKGVQLSLQGDHDILNEIKGGAVKLQLKKPFHWKSLRYAPRIGLNWISSELSNHDFGVPPEKANNRRSAYTLGDTSSFEVGVGTSWAISTSWRFIFGLDLELLDQDIRNSPLVDKKYLFKNFTVLTYAFD